MKGFTRKDPWFSLCGLNCGLCSMKLSGHCGGCGFGNQSCKIARCSMEHCGVEYCYQCGEYSCAHYEHVAEYDSFITHQRQLADMKKARFLGPEAYRQEQERKAALLDLLLTQYNDGRRKTLYCLAVNLLEAGEIEEVLHQTEHDPSLAEAGTKEKAACVAGRLQAIAKEKGILLKLRRKP